MATEDGRHLGQDSRAICDVDGQVERAGDGCEGSARANLGGQGDIGSSATAHGSSDFNEVTEHGGRRRTTTGAAPVQHEFAAGRTFDEDRVERPIHCGQGVVEGNHCWVHPHRELIAVEEFAHRQELDRKTEVTGERDVSSGDFGDALAVHVLGRHLAVKGQRRQDRRLGRSVGAEHVGRWVAFGESQALGLLQYRRVVAATSSHGGQDEVGRPIHDAHHPVDLLASERRNKILELLQEEGSARVRELSLLFKVSEPTVRQDLERLEEQGFITRVHGGAFLKTPEHGRWRVDAVLREHGERIGEGRLVGDGGAGADDAGVIVRHVGDQP